MSAVAGKALENRAESTRDELLAQARCQFVVPHSGLGGVKPLGQGRSDLWAGKTTVAQCLRSLEG